MPRAELLERIGRADCLFHLMHDAVDAEIIAAGRGLRIIASMAIVPATVDVAAATARGIPVRNLLPERLGSTSECERFTHSLSSAPRALPLGHHVALGA
ncbi:MAG: hypothetical protein ACHQ7N_13390 [Candidatus Methylomirabilales bacterium]